VIYVVVATQYSLCLLSMLLTGIFCVEVAHSSSALQSVKVLSTVAMLVLGIGFDVSKYIFWHFHSQSKGYLYNCLALVIFSWSASVAFFMSSHQASIESSRIESQSYIALAREIKSIRNQIRQKTRILETRLNSQFHDQWDKAETLADSVRELEDVLKERIKALEHVGYADVYSNDNLETTSLFQSLSSLFDTSFKAIVFFAYGVLAFLIESCSLGVISLAATIKAQGQSSSILKNSTKKKNYDSPEKLMTINQKMLILRNAIISGETDPVIRRIRRSNYRLSEKNIRQVLVEMKADGLLVDGPRCLTLVNKKCG
jgi:hypothetical protein